MNFLAPSKKNANSLIGQLGEMLAADFLRKKGYVILEKNYYSPAGEIDIIARVGDVLIFVEVKTRATDEYGHPIESVSYQKQRKLREVAGYYLEERPPGCHEYRFDVVGIILKEGEEACFELVCGAFYRGEPK